MIDTKRWILRTPDVLENCVNGLKQLPDDEIWEVVAKPYKLADHTAHSKDEMYTITTEMFLAPTVVEFRGQIHRRYSTSKLKIGEMSEFIERLYQLSAEEGLYMPPQAA
jgi:hypothetical protein